MQETREVEVVLYQTEYNWVDPAPVTSNEKNEATITSNYDYEELPDGTKRIYLDIGLITHALAMDYRTGFELDGEGLPWNIIFAHNIIQPLVEVAIKKSLQAYTDCCEEHGIAHPQSIELNEEYAEGFTSTIVDQYVTRRRFNDEKNERAINTSGLEIEMGTDTELLFECTFTIMDDILYTNHAFDHAHNIDVFTDHVHIQRYNTIKHCCRQPDEDVIELSLFSTVMFLDSLACALQMLVGDKSDLLEATLEGKGIGKEEIKSYIRMGTELFAQFNDMLERSQARVSNIENQPDWYRLMR
ncbi:hypothetical protein [uncultured Acetobacteroides sp.]|uniref:hypothetical protein n=1 Tax=uncultured Acetobacteroides sp. TaxID=1760811 RepID=UPI0029F51789|nr:hypothetical protein [uncultured Acetobacteroides sp.]